MKINKIKSVNTKGLTEILEILRNASKQSQFSTRKRFSSQKRKQTGIIFMFTERKHNTLHRE